MSFTSPAMISLRHALGVPQARIPLNGVVFVSYVLPPVVCAFVVAVLATKPQTRALRAAVWPLVGLSALRAVLSVDMSRGKPEQNFFNLDIVLFMLSITFRALDWALVQEPLVRHIRPANSSPSTVLDALDLLFNARGHGWNRPHGAAQVPRETHPAGRTGFVLQTVFAVVMNGLMTTALQRAFLTLSPLGSGSIPHGSTIFDDSLPFLTQYFRASVISVVTAFMIYSAMQMWYDLASLFGVLVLRQIPSQWPPMFNSPWRATSLADFWGRRWHQLFRRMFLIMGGYPLAWVLGRTGAVLGAFIASGIVHHVSLLSLGHPPIDIRWMLIGFGMMGPGVLIERVFSRMTGRPVGGVFGWVWTMIWLLVWGNVIIEGHARAGMFGVVSGEDPFPAWISPDRLAMSFDAWLHTAV